MLVFSLINRINFHWKMRFCWKLNANLEREREWKKTNSCFLFTLFVQFGWKNVGNVWKGIYAIKIVLLLYRNSKNEPQKHAEQRRKYSIRSDIMQINRKCQKCFESATTVRQKRWKELQIGGGLERLWICGIITLWIPSKRIHSHFVDITSNRIPSALAFCFHVDMMRI
jgi:hypothetical protein